MFKAKFLRRSAPALLMMTVYCTVQSYPVPQAPAEVRVSDRPAPVIEALAQSASHAADLSAEPIQAEHGRGLLFFPLLSEYMAREY